ncbi:MAG: cytochrome-c oxidase, cbb3-type subunit III [Methylococcales bacterium]|jgi:cytochrome c oxidase cbb3-type subunit 3|nr:cytochrome-c oxidase, cbb3-type subunit III [Methylococcales bacterium]
MKDEKDNANSVPDTGHEWDGIRDLTNPPPRWWTIWFHLSWVFVLGYALLYPSIPYLTDNSKGLLGYTQIKELKDDIKVADAEWKQKFSEQENKLSTQSVDQIMQDKDLVKYVIETSKVVFGDNCSPCHGSGGQGNPGYPVLVDDDWLYGGTVTQIFDSISKGREGMMLAHEKQLNEKEADDLVEHVIAMTKGKEHEAGKQLYVTKGCMGCHGMEGKGMEALGAADLTDQIWRFTQGETDQEIRDSVKHTIMYGVNAYGVEKTRKPKMPSFAGRLTEKERKKLAVFVHQLGGGA